MEGEGVNSVASEAAVGREAVRAGEAMDGRDAAQGRDADADSTSYWQGTHMSSPGSSVVKEPGEELPSRDRQRYAVQALYQRDHIAAGLLAIFLGMFGMHKFYLGYNKAAFIMLAASIIGGIFTLGLASAVVWLTAIIEGVLYLSKSQTEFDKAYVLEEREWF